MRRLKLVLIVASFVLLASVIVGFAVSRRSAEKRSLFRGTVMTTAREAKPLTVRDFPKDGIVLRHMGDVRYRQEAEYIFQAPSELRAATNQYSFVVENTSNKAIIALSITYGFPKPGQTTYPIGRLQTNAIQIRFMGSTNASLILPGSKIGYCLALNQENFDFQSGIRYIQMDRPKHPGMTEEIMKNMNESVRAKFAGLDRQLNACERWEVEVEGAVFEDGTFVGTNRRNFFEQMNAKVEGARSLVNELVEKLNNGEPYANLLAHARSYTKTDFKELLKPFGGSLADANDDETFNFHFTKNMLAERIARMSEPEAINYIKNGSQKWAKLTRK